MILKAMSEYLKQSGRVDRCELMRQFDLSEDGVDAMLEFWLKKGKIKRQIVGGSTPQLAKRVIYRWLSENEIPLTQFG